MQTIAAISTPPGKGGIAVIRVSGERAIAVADGVFRAKSGKPLREIRPRTAVFGDICDPRTGEVIDSGICVAFFAPHSYTGEDTVELSCHGGTLVTTSVLSAWDRRDPANSPNARSYRASCPSRKRRRSGF